MLLVLESSKEPKERGNICPQPQTCSYHSSQLTSISSLTDFLLFILAESKLHNSRFVLSYLLLHFKHELSILVVVN